MKGREQLGIFDINETIRAQGNDLGPEVLQGFGQLHESGILTTVVTGRPFKRIQRTLKDNWGRIISDNIPFGAEYGSRIVSLTEDGPVNRLYLPLHKSEVTATLDVIKKNEIEFLIYCPRDVTRDAVIWTPNADAVPQLQERYGYFATALTEPFYHLAQRVYEDKPCMMVVKAAQPGEFQQLFPSDMNISQPHEAVVINQQGAGKGRAVREIADMLEIPLTDIFVAGSGKTDVSMLELPVARRLFVGKKVEDVEGIADVTLIPTVEELGSYLQREFSTDR